MSTQSEFNSVNVIDSFMIPVALINAAGLLALALYNRLAVAIARIRMFNKELFDGTLTINRLESILRREKNSHVRSDTHYELMLHMARKKKTEIQVISIINRAFLIRVALVFLWLAVIFAVLTALLVGFEKYGYYYTVYASINNNFPTNFSSPNAPTPIVIPSVVMFFFSALSFALAAVMSLVELTKGLQAASQEMNFMIHEMGFVVPEKRYKISKEIERHSKEIDRQIEEHSIEIDKLKFQDDDDEIELNKKRKRGQKNSTKKNTENSGENSAVPENEKEDEDSDESSSEESERERKRKRKQAKKLTYANPKTEHSSDGEEPPEIEAARIS